MKLEKKFRIVIEIFNNLFLKLFGLKVKKFKSIYFDMGNYKFNRIKIIEMCLCKDVIEGF